jgi:hypothetical protein
MYLKSFNTNDGDYSLKYLLSSIYETLYSSKIIGMLDLEILRLWIRYF